MTMRVVVDNGPGKRRASSGRSLKSAQPQIVAARGGRRRRAGAARADCRASRGRPSAAAHARRAHDPCAALRRAPCAGGRRSSAAPSWRRCRRRSPKCARWSSAAMRVVSASASRMVEELARARPREGFDAPVRVRPRSGVLRAPRLLDRAAHLGAREDRARLPRAARCSATAASTRSSSSSIARRGARPTLRRDAADDRATPVSNVRAIDGGVTAPSRLPRQRPALRHQGQRQTRPVADRRAMRRRPPPACSR